MAPLRVGVIGCGVVAQVMHLPNLAAHPDRFTIAALCDASESVLATCAVRYRVATTTRDWTDLLTMPLDAVLVLTPGSHAPVVEEFARRGTAVFVEKPVAFSVAEGDGILEAMGIGGAPVMVGYMKRHDPAFARLLELLPTIGAVRLVQATTFETAFRPYLQHQPVAVAADLPPAVRSSFEDDDARRVAAAVGPSADAATASVYRRLLIDGLVHEFNLIRAVMGEVTAVPYADLSADRIAIALRFGDVPCSIDWIDMPSIARYQQRFSFVGDRGSLTLTFFSPYLAHLPARLEIESGEPDSAHSWHTTEVVSYAEPFEDELLAFADLVQHGTAVSMTVEDALADIALCQQVVDVHLNRSFAVAR